MKEKMDLTAEQNTSLSSEQEREFKKWARGNGRIGELKSYDLRGHWLRGLGEGQVGRFKKIQPSTGAKSPAKKKTKPKVKEVSDWVVEEFRGAFIKTDPDPEPEPGELL